MSIRRKYRKRTDEEESALNPKERVKHHGSKITEQVEKIEEIQKKNKKTQEEVMDLLDQLNDYLEKGTVPKRMFKKIRPVLKKLPLRRNRKYRPGKTVELITEVYGAYCELLATDLRVLKEGIPVMQQELYNMLDAQEKLVDTIDGKLLTCGERYAEYATSKYIIDLIKGGMQTEEAIEKAKSDLEEGIFNLLEKELKDNGLYHAEDIRYLKEKGGDAISQIRDQTIQEISDALIGISNVKRCFMMDTILTDAHSEYKEAEAEYKSIINDIGGIMEYSRNVQALVALAKETQERLQSLYDNYMSQYKMLQEAQHTHGSMEKIAADLAQASKAQYQLNDKFHDTMEQMVDLLKRSADLTATLEQKENKLFNPATYDKITDGAKYIRSINAQSRANARDQARAYGVGGGA